VAGLVTRLVQEGKDSLVGLQVDLRKLSVLWTIIWFYIGVVDGWLSVR
jgi:hypothetical protein